MRVKSQRCTYISAQSNLQAGSNLCSTAVFCFKISRLMLTGIAEAESMWFTAARLSTQLKLCSFKQAPVSWISEIYKCTLEQKGNIDKAKHTSQSVSHSLHMSLHKAQENTPVCCSYHSGIITPQQVHQHTQNASADNSRAGDLRILQLRLRPTMRAILC